MNGDFGIFARAAAVGLSLVLIPVTAGALVTPAALISLSETGTSAQIGNGMQQSDSKMFMPNPFSYNYVAGDGLSTKQGSGEVFQLQLDGDPKVILNTIAKVLGIEGEIQEPEYSTPEYPTYLIGSLDGTGPSATIGWSGTGSWWYNNPVAYPMPNCKTWEAPSDGTSYCSTYEDQKTTPELLPSESEMVSEAMKVFAAVGHPVYSADIKTATNDWGSSAFTSLQIGGQDSPIEWSINWGPTGIIGSVSGNSVKAVSRGMFETISERDAVARMGDWRFSGQLAQSAWSKYQPESSGRVIAYDDAVTSEPAPDISAPVPGESPTPSPSVVTVIVNKAAETQVMIWDKTGTAWIVPGVILFSGEGWITPVFTLEDGVVALPEPAEITPMLK